jgi:hypothetical protein
MGDLLSAIADDYNEYVDYCKKLKVEPVNDYGESSFYRHWDELKFEREEKNGRIRIPSDERLFDSLNNIGYDIDILKAIVQNSSYITKKEYADYLKHFDKTLEQLKKWKENLIKYIKKNNDDL